MRTKQTTTSEFFSDLSFNFAHLLDEADDYNISIEAGEEPDVDTFRAHSVVLRCRSVYFHSALPKECARTDDKLMVFKKPNIPASAFRIIIKYLYSGVISLEGEISPTLFQLLLAADELCITEIMSFVQDVLIVNHRDWLDLNFEYIRHTVYDHELFDKLQDYCNDMFCANPHLIFARADFANVSEQLLLTLIRRNELRLEEVEVWEQIIRWGVQQSPPLHQHVDEWRLSDFAELKRRLQNLIPHIRFFQISMRDYFNKVRPYERVLPDEILLDVQRYYFNSPTENTLLLPPRQGRTDSDIINSTEAALISSWVDRLDRKSFGWSPYGPLENPYVFEPAFRGTNDDLMAGELHRRLNELDETLVVFQMRDGRVIGGHHLLHSDGHLNERDGFVFALGQDDISDSVVSRISDVRHAIGTGSSSAVDSGINGVNGDIEHYDGDYEDPRLHAVNTLATLIRHPTQSQVESLYDSDCDGSDNLSSNTSFNEEHDLERNQTEVVKFEVFNLLSRRKNKRLSHVPFNMN